MALPDTRIGIAYSTSTMRTTLDVLVHLILFPWPESLSSIIHQHHTDNHTSARLPFPCFRAQDPCGTTPASPTGWPPEWGNRSRWRGGRGLLTDFDRCLWLAL